MEKIDVSSANNLTVDRISIDRSLIQIRKKRSSQIDPCGTPALTGNHSDVWPFKTTRSNLLPNKLQIRSNKSSQIPIQGGHSSKTLKF